MPVTYYDSRIEIPGLLEIPCLMYCPSSPLPASGNVDKLMTSPSLSQDGLCHHNLRMGTRFRVTRSGGHERRHASHNVVSKMDGAHGLSLCARPLPVCSIHFRYPTSEAGGSTLYREKQIRNWDESGDLEIDNVRRARLTDRVALERSLPILLRRKDKSAFHN